MTTPREPIRRLEDLDALDVNEIREGYSDGFAGDPEPGGNRSLAYWHGWRNGNSDRNNTSDAAQRELARAYVKRGKKA